MLDIESPAMESNGDSFLPELGQGLGQTADWSMEQVAPEPLTNILPQDSDSSQDVPAPPQPPEEQINSSELGSVEKAVEQFQLASAQLFQAEQPPLPPQPAEEAEQPSEPRTEYEEAQQYSQEMSIEQEAAVNNGGQGNKSIVAMHFLFKDISPWNTGKNVPFRKHLTIYRFLSTLFFIFSCLCFDSEFVLFIIYLPYSSN